MARSVGRFEGARRADRLRAQLRARHRGWRRPRPRVVPRPGGMVTSVLASVLAAEAGGRVSGAGFPLLTALILVPAIGALLVALVPRSRGDVARLVGVSASGATAALSVWLVTQFDRRDAGFQFTSDHLWIKDLGISWHLGVDGLSLFLVLLTGLLFP